MGKLRRVILVLIGAIAGFFSIVLLGVNLYVQSQAAQAKIQQEVSHRIGAPVKIRQISVTPWAGLKLSGITIPQTQTQAGTSGDFLTARTFQLRIRMLSLFSRRLVVKEVSLINPDVLWSQNAEGKWRLPGRGERPTPTPTPVPTSPPESESPETPLPASSPAPPGTPLEVEPPKIADAAKTGKGPGFSVTPEIQRVNMRHGNFRFLDQSGSLAANFQGIDFRSNVRGPSSIRGNAKVAKISLRNRFFLNRLQSPFSYEPDVLELAKISARAGGGEINGHFAMQPESEDSPFTASVTFKDVEADQIVSDAGGPNGMVKGKLEGQFEGAGKAANPNTLTGTGEIFLRDGQVRQYSLLVALGQVLQIEELTQLQLQEAHAKYHVASGMVTIDQLMLRSPNIRLSATGTIGFNGKLKLESQLAINEKIRGQLFKMMRENFQPIDEPGYYGLDFHVGGTVERPKTNLVDRMVGRNLKDLVDGFFGGGKPKKKKKRDAEPRSDEEMASPTPADEDLDRDALQKPTPP